MNKSTVLIVFFAALLMLAFSSQNGVWSLDIPAVFASDDDSKDKDKDKSSLAGPLICQCGVAADAKDKADKADKAGKDSKDAKDSKDKADKDKADKDDDKDASDKDKSDAKDKADKADKDYNDAKDSKDKADKDKKDVDDSFAAGSPCTCPDGSPGFWGTDPTGGGSGGPSSGNQKPEAFREVHGQ